MYECWLEDAYNHNMQLQRIHNSTIRGISFRRAKHAVMESLVLLDICPSIRQIPGVIFSWCGTLYRQDAANMLSKNTLATVCSLRPPKYDWLSGRPH